MTIKAWDWLPDGALVATPVLQVIDEALDAFSRRWFDSYRIARQRLAFAAPASTPVVSSTPHFAVRLSAAQTDLLAGHALDMDLSRLEIGEADRDLIDAFGVEIVRDLARTLETYLVEGDEPTGLGDLSGSVTLDLVDQDGRKVGAVETSRAVLARTRLAALTHRAAKGSLTPVRAATADTVVRLSARLGSAAITLPEARRLAPGDVIVLDRQLKEPIEIVSAEDGSTVACAMIVDAASPRSLRLQSAGRGAGS